MRLLFHALMPTHIILESNSEDDFYVGDTLAILLSLPPLLTSYDYESMYLNIALNRCMTLL